MQMKRREMLQLMGLAGTALLLPKTLIAGVLKTDGNTAIWEKAWCNLGKFAANRYQFRYIEPVENLPKVFIYGDSISIGYTEYVRKSFSGKACVYRLYENGSSSNEFIAKMEKLRKGMFKPSFKDGWDFQWDLIHFNVGLHDLKYILNGKLDKENGQQVTSLEKYEENLIEIIEYLRTNYPKAKLVFATTTPVPEGEAGRFVGDEVKYNKVACEVLKRYKFVVINDLYSFSLPLIQQYGEGKGNVHYVPEGQRLQGIEVAGVIGEQLGITPVTCPPVEVVLQELKAYESKTGNKQNAVIH
jgi:hypothetical protein